ncbi:uncharacterized protein LOC106654423 [Trichogramma pretiosum]|uniref:uncharacterized protein LOC106654423 n=1 Tax=Trichogramma pretiosum TaxID=7493 RepID=UPI0006C9D299|nr:uncharacterized protein LOC106654423 [Trichogramma pretiosum]
MMVFAWLRKLFQRFKAKKTPSKKFRDQEQRLTINKLIKEENEKLEKCVQEKVSILQIKLDQIKDRVKKFEDVEVSSAKPSLLFDTSEVRTHTKEEFYSNFMPVKVAPESNDYFVIDGTTLLYKFCWNKKMSVDTLIKTYVHYVKEHYKGNCLIIFNDYVENVDHEADFDESSTIFTSEKIFHSKAADRIHLVQLIRKELHRYNFRTKFVKGEGTLQIVEAAIQKVNKKYKTWIVGEDIDLLVVFAAKAQNLDNIFMLRQGNGFKFQAFDANSFIHPGMQNIILFLHAFSGCDTTFYFNNRGKNMLKSSILVSTSFKSCFPIEN